MFAYGTKEMLTWHMNPSSATQLRHVWGKLLARVYESFKPAAISRAEQLWRKNIGRRQTGACSKLYSSRSAANWNLTQAAAQAQDCGGLTDCTGKEMDAHAVVGLERTERDSTHLSHGQWSQREQENEGIDYPTSVLKWCMTLAKQASKYNGAGGDLLLLLMLFHFAEEPQSMMEPFWQVP